MRAALLFAALLPLVSRADVLPEGAKPWTSEVVLENLGDYPDYAVAAFPTSFSNGRPDEPQAELLAPGAPFSPSGRWHTPELVAIARADLTGDLASLLAGTSIDGGAAPTIHHSGIHVAPRKFVDEKTPGAGTRTTYHIASIANGRLELVQVSQVVVDENGTPVQPPRGVAGSKRWIFAFAFLGPLAGFAALFFALRRLRSRPPPPSNGEAPKDATQ